MISKKKFGSLLILSLLFPTHIHPEPKLTTTRHVQHALVYKGNLNSFLHKMGRAEGQGRIDLINESGHMGKYQFSPKTLKLIGYDTTQEVFLTNESLQDSAMVKLIAQNKRILRKTIRNFSGKRYRGIYITPSGIIAAAHLVGPGGVLAFFYPDKYNYPTEDGNGVRIEQYLVKFGGYKI